MSWQEELETLLAPETQQEEREMMLKDLLARAPEISEEVQAALQSKGPVLTRTSRGHRVPASCVLDVPAAQGSLAAAPHALYVRRVRAPASGVPYVPYT